MQKTYESLNSIPNRYALLDDIEETLLFDSSQSLLLIDVVRFSDVSSNFGYEFGDLILLEIANRILFLFGDTVIFGRISGDIFGMVLSGIHHRRDLYQFYTYLIEHFKTPIQCDEHAFIVDFNVGATANPKHNTNVNAFFSLAEIALKQAKTNKFDNFQYTHELKNEEGGRSLTLKADLKRALNNQELEIYLQPKIELKSLAIVGAECLLRWNHPLDGLLFPGALIEAAESYNMMNELGYWTLEESIKTSVYLSQVGLSIKLSVNMSPTQLYDLNFVSTLTALAKNYNFNLSLLELELTEDVALSNSVLVKRQLSDIRQLGVSIAMDDFGKGYSNLGYMRDIEIDCIKIDKSFVMGIDQNPINKAIVEASLIIAKAANCELVAEGIENIQHLHVLRELGVTTGQGFLFSKAVSLSHFEELASKDIIVGTSYVREHTLSSNG